MHMRSQARAAAQCAVAATAVEVRGALCLCTRNCTEPGTVGVIVHFIAKVVKTRCKSTLVLLFNMVVAARICSYVFKHP